MPVTEVRLKNGKSALDELKSFGVKTIIRYYDWPEESIRCKTLMLDEVDAIISAGLSIAVVFQHHNDDPETFFDPGRGTTDAKRSLELANANGQPYGTAIYFGVDGVDQALESVAWEYSKSSGKPISAQRKRQLMSGKYPMSEGAFQKHNRFYLRFLEYRERVFKRPPSVLTGKDMLPFIDHYFEAVKAEFDRASGGNATKSYKIGVYGSGLVCEHMLLKPYVKYCWLAQSAGWPGTGEFKPTKQWHLAQELVTTCPWLYAREGAKSVGFDFNVVNRGKPSFGQWPSRRNDVRAIARPETCSARP
jgi:hypothetical protein